MSARAIIQKALCIAAIGQAAATFEYPADRKRFVMDLYERGVITGQTAELLIEAYRLEAV